MQGHADAPLDDIGREQAHALAARLQDEVFEAIYSSPLARARETAEILAAARRQPILFDQRLVERDLGQWTGLTGDEVNERFPDYLGHDWRREGPPGGESQAALIARVDAALGEIIAAYRESAVAVVGHGGALSAYIAHTLGAPVEKWVAFSFPNTGVARLDVRRDRLRVLSVGDDRHLDAIRISASP